MSKAAGARKPSESQKAKTGVMNSMTQPTKKKQTRLVLWKEHLKDPIIALDKALKCV